MMKKAIIYLLIFMGIQLVGGALVNTLWMLLSKSSDMSPAQLITVTLVTSIVTIVVFLWMRWTEVSPTWLRTRPWLVLLWSVVAALGAVIPSAWLQEQMPELPNWVENEFDMILQDRWGYMAIGLLAPFTEELVFRGAILRRLLSSSRLSVWGAIAVSALFFSLVHMNPTQMPHAFVIGLLLGWMYWRTGSILPGVAYHRAAAHPVARPLPVASLDATGRRETLPVKQGALRYTSERAASDFVRWAARSSLVCYEKFERK